jgi:hypothetical protein
VLNITSTLFSQIFHGSKCWNNTLYFCIILLYCHSRIWPQIKVHTAWFLQISIIAEHTKLVNFKEYDQNMYGNWVLLYVNTTNAFVYLQSDWILHVNVSPSVQMLKYLNN